MNKFAPGKFKSEVQNSEFMEMRSEMYIVLYDDCWGEEEKNRHWDKESSCFDFLYKEMMQSVKAKLCDLYFVIFWDNLKKVTL